MSIKHVVMFSSGAGSWAAARRVADTMPVGDELVLLFCDVQGGNESPHVGEDPDNYRFLHDAHADLGGELVILNEGRDIWEVFKDDRFLGNSRLANCSKFLKQIPARKWLEENCTPEDCIVYVGIDWTETHRLPAIEKAYLPYIAKAPLCEPPYSDKEAILADLRARGIEPPRLYALGFAHANCGGGCVRAGVGQFVKLLDVMPERFAVWEQKEAELRDHLGKDVTILREQRNGTRVNISLESLRQRIEAQPDQLTISGAISAGFDLDDVGGCGCFVQESV